MAEISGDLIVIKVRPNLSGQAFKQIVCTDNVQLGITNDISTKKTSCGPKSAPARPTFELSGSGLFKTQQDQVSASEVSWDDIKEWQKQKQKMDFMFINNANSQYTAGAAVSEIGSAYFSNSTFTGNADEGFATFDFTLTGSGDLGSYDS